MPETVLKLTKLASCSGCGAKVGAGTLAKLLGGIAPLPDENLLVGFERSDDAAVYRLREDLAVVQTVDFFPPIDDDPYLYGQIAAANALSDIYAMGGEPKLALNIMCICDALPDSAVHEILRGGSDKAAEAGALLCGGHSIKGPEPLYGLSVTGLVHPDRFWRNCGAQPGDALLLTKPLGTGVLVAAGKAGLLDEATHARAAAQMAALNRAARDAAVRFRVHACTDVTGFSLLGHLLEMAEGSAVSARIDIAAVPLLPHAMELAARGILPEGMYRNRAFAEAQVDAGETPLPLQDLLFDPQTSGGLLLAVHPDDAAALLAALPAGSAAIGRIAAYENSKKRIALA